MKIATMMRMRMRYKEDSEYEDISPGSASTIGRVRRDTKVRLAHFSVKEYLE